MHIKRFLVLFLVLWANLTLAAPKLQYEVTITNLTRGQTFTPQLVLTHDKSVKIFEAGEAASDALELLAEGGDTGPLTDELSEHPRSIGEITTISGLLGPGESATVMIKASHRRRYLSLAAMLIPTNDTFVALQRVRLPHHGSRVFTALAYDAGTEANDQNCAHMPGPRCGGEGPSSPSEDDEGFIYVSNGFHDLGSADENGNEILGPAVYDWRNPVARIKIRRIRF